MTNDEQPDERLRPNAPKPRGHRSPADRTYIQADGLLAEVLCSAYLLELTAIRAQELRESHGMHRPDECWVHLQAAVKLLEF